MYEYKVTFRSEKSDSMRTDYVKASCGSDAYDLAADLLEENEDIFDVECMG